MTTPDPGQPAEPPEDRAEPPAMLPRREPRPLVTTLRGWPIVVIGLGAVGTLAAVTVLPGLLKDDPAPVQAAPLRLGDPRGLRGMPEDYSQVPPPAVPPQEVAEVPRDAGTGTGAETPVPSTGGRRNTGPTRAELLRAARMADLSPVGIGRNGRRGVVQANAEGDPDGGGGRSGGQGGRMYSRYGLTQPFDCQVNAGTNIPAMLEYRLTSASPGTAAAVVTRDVWSADKSCLAIPRGTRFVGRYRTEVKEGDVRMGILWTGLTRPPPRNDSIELADTVAGDPDGTAGVSGEVNEHFWRKLGFVAAATLLDIGTTAITAEGDGGVGAAIAGIFADNAADPIDEWARRQLDIPPTIEVEPRQISIVLAQHLPMDEFRAGR